MRRWLFIMAFIDKSNPLHGAWNPAWKIPARHSFQSIKHVGKNPKGLFVTWITNWLIKPFTMYGIASLFFCGLQNVYHTGTGNGISGRRHADLFFGYQEYGKDYFENTLKLPHTIIAH